MSLTDIAMQDLKGPARFTDTSNAEKLRDMFGDKIRYDHKRRRWLIWEGHRWQPDSDGIVSRMAIEAARKQYEDAGEIEDLTKRTKASVWAIQSESKMRLDATTGIAKNLLPIADKGDGWDKDQMLLCCKNGVVELVSGLLRKGEPEDQISMQANVDFDSLAKCPRWEQFIDEVFEGNKELIHYVHKALGYSITGSVKEQAAFFCFGSGSNGKSVLFKTIREILGDYAYDAPATLLQRNTMATNSNDVASTEFKRFLVSSETLSTAKLNEQRLKGWTGGDKVTARYLYSEYFSFDPTVKPWLFINHRPAVEDDSFGFWRRVRLIPFNRIFQPEEQDKDLLHKLQNEASGIFNWLISGCLLWQEEGLEPTPGIVKSATQDYRQENDVLAEFLFNQCEEAEENVVQSSEIYKAYTQWTETQGIKGRDVLSIQNFGRRLGDKFVKITKNVGTFYKGIALREKKSGGYDGSFKHEVVDTTSVLVNPLYEDNENSLLKTTQYPPLSHSKAPQSTTGTNREKCGVCSSEKTWLKDQKRYICLTCHPL